MLFDTHAHLNDPAFDEDRAELLETFKDAGVGLVLNAGCSLESSHDCIALAEAYPWIYCSVGTHPDTADEVNEDVLEAYRQMCKHPKVKGVFHCYSGSAEMARQLVNLGWYIGFTGVLTFKNARKAVETAASIPLDRIVLETDCPFMAPEPYRGKRNHPGYLPRMAEKLAQIRGISVEEVIRITTENAKRLYRIED